MGMPSVAMVKRPEFARYLAAIAVMSSAILEILDTSVVNVSLPHIAGNLSASIPEATWVLTSYIVANAVILPLTGWLTNFFGRKRLLLTVVTGFTVSSMLCGLAPSLPLLVFFRVMQGITGGGLQPLSQAVLFEEFPVSQHKRAIAFWGLGVVVAPTLAPTFGGWITQNYSWRWVFFINLPIGIVSLVLIWLFVHNPPYNRRGSLRFDGWGIGMLAIGIASLQIMFDKGQEVGWFDSGLIITLAVLAGILLPLFVFRQLSVAHPLVKLRLFKNRNFACGTLVATVMSFVLYGSLVLVPLFMQTLLGWSPMTTGIWTSPRGVGAAAGMILQWQHWFKRFDDRKVVVIGFGATSVIFFLYARMNLNSGMRDIMVPQFFQGLAVSLAFVPLNTLSMGLLKKRRMPYATSLFSACRNIGASMGISFTAFFLDRRAQFHQARLVEHVSAFNPVAQAHLDKLARFFQSQNGDPVRARAQGLLATYHAVSRQASLLSFLDTFQVLGIFFLCIVPLVFLMRRPPAEKVTK